MNHSCGPIGDCVDDAIRENRGAESTEVFPHPNGERLAAVWNFFPARDLIGDCFDAGGQRFVGGPSALAGPEGRETGQ